MKFKALASSSKGNAYVISDKETRLLLECGVSHKKLRELTGFSLSEFAGCLITHEHKDHSKCAADLIADGMRVYMSEGTADALGLHATTIIGAMEQFNVGTFDIVPFSTFHDAAEPLGFLIKSRTDGEVLAFATDTVNLRYRFPGLNILCIEANYDAAILERHTKLPDKVRHRITNSHMEIGTLCEYLSELDLSSCREVHLLHLSDGSSNETEFILKAAQCVPHGVKVLAAPKEYKK